MIQYVVAQRDTNQESDRSSAKQVMNEKTKEWTSVRSTPKVPLILLSTH